MADNNRSYNKNDSFVLNYSKQIHLSILMKNLLGWHIGSNVYVPLKQVGPEALLGSNPALHWYISRAPCFMGASMSPSSAVPLSIAGTLHFSGKQREVIARYIKTTNYTITLFLIGISIVNDINKIVLNWNINCE